MFPRRAPWTCQARDEPRSLLGSGVAGGQLQHVSAVRHWRRAELPLVAIPFEGPPVEGDGAFGERPADLSTGGRLVRVPGGYVPPVCAGTILYKRVRRKRRRRRFWGRQRGSRPNFGGLNSCHSTPLRSRVATSWASRRTMWPSVSRGPFSPLFGCRTAVAASASRIVAYG